MRAGERAGGRTDGRSDAERGAVTIVVTILTLGLLMVAGLVVDGGALVSAHRSATERADAAARAGAQAVSEDTLRHRGTAPDPRAAVDAARRHLRATGTDGSVRVAGGSIEVTVRVQQRTALLGLAGVNRFSVTATGRARLVRGVRHGET